MLRLINIFRTSQNLRSFTRQLTTVVSQVTGFNFLVTADGDNLTDAEGNLLYINEIQG